MHDLEGSALPVPVEERAPQHPGRPAVTHEGWSPPDGVLERVRTRPAGSAELVVPRSGGHRHRTTGGAPTLSLPKPSSGNPLPGRGRLEQQQRIIRRRMAAWPVTRAHHTPGATHVRPGKPNGVGSIRHPTGLLPSAGLRMGDPAADEAPVSRLRRVLVLISLLVAGAVAGPVAASALLAPVVVLGPATVLSRQPPPPPTSGATSSQLGLFEDLQYLTGSALDARLGDYQALGVQWARFQLLWANVQRSGPGSYDWAPVDELVTKLGQRGIRPLAVVGTTPPWAARVAGCSQDTCAPTDPAQLAAFARTAATRYAGKIAAYELWNEPNTATFYAPAPDPVAYTRLLRATYPAIKGADPRATVVTGGLAPAVTVLTASGAAQTVQPVDFVATMYWNGAHDAFDAVGWHPYSYPQMPGGSDPGSAWVQLYGSPLNVRGLMVANGDGNKTVWATEYGAHTDPAGEGYVTEAQQAAHLASGIDAWRTYSWAGPMIVYQLRDRGTDYADRENFFGLQRYDGTNKPGYGAVATRVRR